MRTTGSIAQSATGDTSTAWKKNLAEVEILRTDGTRETHEVGKSILMDWCHRMIGAETVDTVNLRDGRVMIVDDAGYEVDVTTRDGEWMGKPAVIEERKAVKARKPVNAAATTLYHGICKPGTTHQIVGDVAIVWDKDFA